MSFVHLPIPTLELTVGRFRAPLGLDGYTGAQNPVRRCKVVHRSKVRPVDFSPAYAPRARLLRKLRNEQRDEEAIPLLERGATNMIKSPAHILPVDAESYADKVALTLRVEEWKQRNWN